MKRMATVAAVLFGIFAVLCLSTPSWRYGPFSWLPLWSFEHLAGGPVKLGVLNLLPVLILLAWIPAQRQKRSWSWGPRALTTPLALFTAWALFRLAGAPFRFWFTLGGDFALLWFTYLYVVNQRPPLRLALATVIVVQSVVGALQFFTQADLGLVALGELPLNPAFSGVTVLQARGEPWLRAYGLTAHPNLYGALLALCLLLIVVSGPLRSRRQSWPLLLAFVLGFAGLFFSFSRTAWLGAGIGFAVWLLLSRRGSAVPRPRIRWWLLLFALVAALLLLSYGDLVLSRLSNLDQPLEARSINQRLYDARLALQLARQNPLLGVGLGQNVDAAVELDAGARRVHNVLLLALAELGIPGLLLVLWLLLAPVGAYWRRLYAGDYARTAAGFAPWAAILVVNQFDTTLWLTGNWQTAILFALGAANAARFLQSPATDQMPVVEQAAAAHSA